MLFIDKRKSAHAKMDAPPAYAMYSVVRVTDTDSDILPVTLPKFSRTYHHLTARSDKHKIGVVGSLTAMPDVTELCNKLVLVIAMI